MRDGGVGARASTSFRPPLMMNSLQQARANLAY
jgi:hypothetical protein